MSSTPLDKAVNLLLGAAAVVVVVASFGVGTSPGRGLVARAPAPPRFLEAWHELLPHSLALNDPAQADALLLFVDFECGACRRYHEETIAPLVRSLPSALHVAIVHLPLPQHRFANIAARAAECANEQGRLPEMVDVLYAKQDSLGLKSWQGFAQEAGVADTLGFVSCIDGRNAFPRIDAGREWARALQIPGTPSVVLNGWLFPTPPSQDSLLLVLDALRVGRTPL